MHIRNLKRNISGSNHSSRNFNHNFEPVDRDKMSLSVACFVHNLEKSGRGSFRVRNFLYSLRNQIESYIDLKIIIFNWSNDNSFEEIDKYCKEYRAIHIYKKFEGKTWNKPKALNYALSHFPSDYIMGTDIDYIFAPNFLKNIQKYASESRILLCKVHKLKKSDKDIIYTVEDYDTLLSRSEYYNNNAANGAAQVVYGQWFVQNKGYHEGMEMWGCMDNEFVQLSKLKGLEVCWMDKYTTIIHQYHLEDKLNQKHHLYNIAQKVRKQNARFLRSKKTNRNGSNWGNIPIDLKNDYSISLDQCNDNLMGGFVNVDKKS